MKPTELLSFAQITREYNVSNTTIKRWEAYGLPVMRIPGRGKKPMARVRRSDLEAWIAGGGTDARKQRVPRNFIQRMAG
ncbi:helix-turn-helix domain-containing protein [bacterium]|nr:helix-turn-helix domain-containing protein [bacterium]